GLLAAEQVGELAGDLAAGRVLAERQPGDPDDDQQQRGERQRGVERQGGPEPGALVVDELLPRLLDRVPRGAPAHVALPGGCVARTRRVPRPGRTAAGLRTPTRSVGE